MQAVLSHPQFQANPIAAISNHIVASLKNNAGGKSGGGAVAGGGGGHRAGAKKKDNMAGGGGGGGVNKKGVIDVKGESDEVALANQLRGAAASKRGIKFAGDGGGGAGVCLLYTSPSPRDATLSRMPSSA